MGKQNILMRIQYYKQMIYSDEDKRLVDEYKQTNIALRKQLSNLNNEIDRILIKRANKIGLQKLPNVNKKITDPTIMQHQIQNLKKRLELLEKDAQSYKSKTHINYYQKIKQLEDAVQQKETEMDQCRRLIKLYERKDKIADVRASKATPKIDTRIAKLQEQISRCQKMQKDLIKQISYQQANGHKANGYLQQLTSKHEEVIQKKQKQKKTYSPPKVIETKPSASIDEEQWKQLKRQFLIFKQSKQNEQFALNQQNERLRGEVKEWERKVKQKKKRIQSLNQRVQRSKDRQSRVNSTLNDPNDNKGYRYRDRNNSIQYNTKQ